MSIDLSVPSITSVIPKIIVFGVGGAGCNAVNNMIRSNLEGADFIVANTDAQSLEYTIAKKKIQLGAELTRGLGAGSLPEIGQSAAEESIEEITEHMNEANMLFITAGMGGGTGTGAAPVIARAAKEHRILTVGVITKPFIFEGSRRMLVAEKGIEELQKYVDTLIVIPNQNLFRIANEKTTLAQAFKLADDVLYAGVRGITDLMVMPGLINLDFADIKSIMSEMGKAMMGTGEASGDERAIKAAEAAISNPLLDNISMKGARGILINITGSPDNMTLFEVDAAANRVREEVDKDANIIFGSTFSEDVGDSIRVSVVATGIDCKKTPQDPKVSNNNNTNTIEEFSSLEIIDPDDEEDSSYRKNLVDQDNKPHAQSSSFLKQQQDYQKSNKEMVNTAQEVFDKINKKDNSSNKDTSDWNIDIPAFLRRKNK